MAITVGRMKFRLLAVMVMTAGTLVNAVPASATSPQAIRCGAFLTHDAYLAADLTCPAGNGVTVTASISIDLRGHHFIGSKSGTGVTVRYPASLKISHGRLAGWRTGLTVVPLAATYPGDLQLVTITAVDFMRNTNGVLPGPYGTTQKIVVYRSWFQSNYYGIGGPGTPVGEIQVWDSTFRHNRDGIFQDGSAYSEYPSVVVNRSEFSDNDDAGISCVVADCTVTDSSLSGNYEGLTASGVGTHLVVQESQINSNSRGVIVHSGANSQVLNNTLDDDDQGIVFFSSGSGLASGNSLRSGGIVVDDEEPTPTLPTPVVEIVHNTVTAAVEGIATGGTISVRVGSNLSTDNLDYGIHVSPGPYQIGDPDAGGNRAFGNGQTLQCVGVVCSR